MFTQIMSSPYMIGALLLVTVVVFVKLAFLTKESNDSYKVHLDDIVSNIIQVGNEDGRTVWHEDETRHATYTVLGNRPGYRRIWVRYVIKRDFKIVHVECSWRCVSDEHRYADAIRATFEKFGVTASVAYSCNEPAENEMFVYPAPGTEQHA